MKDLVFIVILNLRSIKYLFMILLINVLFMLELSASNTEHNKHFTFPDWKNLHKINTEALRSDSHSAWFDIYINVLAKKPYMQQSSLLPVGSIVVKPLYPDPDRSEISKLTIMIKMEKGYDSDNGDWWYGVYDETGMEGSYQGKIKSCIKCHTHGKETDYMFSESVMDNINDMNF